MSATVDEQLSAVHPQMLRIDTQGVMRRVIGRAFEWALESAHVAKKEAAARMGYADPGVIGRWVSGAERLQLDKIAAALPEVYRELLIGLLEACEGVEIRTSILVERKAV